MFGPPTTRQSRPGAGALAVRKICGAAPPFWLGRDKPGSVAPLRLVGCLISTPAPSWAYFYSIFSLSLFSSPLRCYVSSPTLHIGLLCLSLHHYLPLLQYWGVFLSVCITKKNQKKPTLLSLWFGSQYSLAPPNFFLFVFVLHWHLPRWLELPVTGLAGSMHRIH